MCIRDRPRDWRGTSAFNWGLPSEGQSIHPEADIYGGQEPLDFYSQDLQSLHPEADIYGGQEPLDFYSQDLQSLHPEANLYMGQNPANFYGGYF